MSGNFNFGSLTGANGKKIDWSTAKKYDTNGDGTLNTTEYNAMLKEMSADGFNGAPAFGNLDSDKNGTITKAEFIAADQKIQIGDFVDNYFETNPTNASANMQTAALSYINSFIASYSADSKNDMSKMAAKFQASFATFVANFTKSVDDVNAKKADPKYLATLTTTVKSSNSDGYISNTEAANIKDAAKDFAAQKALTGDFTFLKSLGVTDAQLATLKTLVAKLPTSADPAAILKSIDAEIATLIKSVNVNTIVSSANKLEENATVADQKAQINKYVEDYFEGQAKVGTVNADYKAATLAFASAYPATYLADAKNAGKTSEMFTKFQTDLASFWTSYTAGAAAIENAKKTDGLSTLTTVVKEANNGNITSDEAAKIKAAAGDYAAQQALTGSYTFLKSLGVTDAQMTTLRALVGKVANATDPKAALAAVIAEITKLIEAVGAPKIIQTTAQLETDAVAVAQKKLIADSLQKHLEDEATAGTLDANFKSAVTTFATSYAATYMADAKNDVSKMASQFEIDYKKFKEDFAAAGKSIADVKEKTDGLDNLKAAVKKGNANGNISTDESAEIRTAAGDYSTQQALNGDYSFLKSLGVTDAQMTTLKALVAKVATSADPKAALAAVQAEITKLVGAVGSLKIVSVVAKAEIDATVTEQKAQITKIVDEYVEANAEDIDANFKSAATAYATSFEATYMADAKNDLSQMATKFKEAFPKFCTNYAAGAATLDAMKTDTQPLKDLISTVNDSKANGNISNDETAKIKTAAADFATKQAVSGDYSFLTSVGVSTAKLTTLKGLVKNLASATDIDAALKAITAEITTLLASVAVDKIATATGVLEAAANKKSASTYSVDAKELDYSKLPNYKDNVNTEVNRAGKDAAKGPAGVDIESMKSQMRAQVQAECKAAGVEFDEALFNSVFAASKELAVDASVTGQHSTTFRHSSSSYNVRDLMKNFVATFNTTMAATIEKLNKAADLKAANSVVPGEEEMTTSLLDEDPSTLTDDEKKLQQLQKDLLTKGDDKVTDVDSKYTLLGLAQKNVNTANADAKTQAGVIIDTLTAGIITRMKATLGDKFDANKVNNMITEARDATIEGVGRNSTMSDVVSTFITKFNEKYLDLKTGESV